MMNENPSSSSSKSQLQTAAQVNDPEPVLKIHDVFISFRGEDTRASFTSHLYTTLQNAGITVFIDDIDLQRGDHISASLSLAIQQSQIAIIVFSINYPDSRWCLDELMKIMECRRTLGQVVVPVFYHLDPSDVRHQRGKFGVSFQRLTLADIRSRAPLKLMSSWREMLHKAASIAGFVVLNSKNESEDIKRIVDKVSHLLNKTDLFIAHNPVGVESRVQDVIRLLQPIQSKDVRFLGMWGMGGIGKTTVAKAIYNKIGRNFEGRNFIANIRESREKIAGLVGLQEQLLFDIFKEMTIKIPHIGSGINTLQSKLRKKKVLIILDDVSTIEQLNTFCGSREWFGPGSIIIITSRNLHLLKGRVHNIYKMSIMNESESIELFSWNAFMQACPTRDFVNITKNVVEYSGGLPLALEVLGSNLLNKMKSEWEFVLEKLKRIPNSQVHKKLRISYDGLNDDDEKEIFLDIACFFIGMDKNDVIHVLNDCGRSAEVGISILVERSLVTIDDKNMIGMHDLVRDMGREIIREESPREPEKRSRLWSQEDVIDILSRQNGKKCVMGLALKLPSANAKCFNTKAFQKMKRLKLLQLAEVKFDGDFEYVSRDLRWLSWNGLSDIPTNFHPENLVSIELENNNVELLWNKTLMMEKLKILNLSHSHHLTQSPDFSNMPNLEKIVLKDCPLLSEISPSIGHLNKILLINLEDCISLCSLPRSIYKLKSLKTLILSGCLKIEKLEEDLKQMESSSRVPFSVIGSKSIGYISLWSYEGFSHDVFPSIIWSWMSATNKLPSQFQTSTIIPPLGLLDEPHSSSQELSSISKYLPNLRSLWVECKSEDQLSLHAKIILDALYATVSKDLESTATTSQVSNSTTRTLIHCCSQVHVSGSKHWLKSIFIQMGVNCQVTNCLKEKILQNMDVNGSDACFFPIGGYLDCVTFTSEGSSVTFQVPQVDGCNLKTMMCIIYTSTPDNITYGLKNVLVNNYTKATIQLYKGEALVSIEDEEGQRVVSSLEPDLNAIACSDDENECSTKRFHTQEVPSDEFNQNRKKKSRVE